MKFAYKIAFASALITAISIIILLFTFDYYNHREQEIAIYENIENTTTFIAGQIDEHINELVILTRTLSNIDNLKEDLAVSNAEFDSLSDIDRATLISDLNDTWMVTSDIYDPFIQERMSNDYADFLRNLGELNPELYGEAFVTNKYGVMTSTTGKLTTLAHYDKYWWQGAYNEGEGIIYLDDRGYDESVEGYVLGIVVPVYDNGDIIGMLKVNFNIQNIMTSTMIGMAEGTGFGEFQIVRSLGLIVSKDGVEPLTESIDETLLTSLLIGELISGEKIIDGVDMYYAIDPLSFTFNDEEMIFGGNYNSIDHSLGNQGEFWSVIYTITDSEANEAIHESLNKLIYGGIILIIVMFIITFIVTNSLFKPMNKMLGAVQLVSSGDLSHRVKNTTNDEIGVLGIAFNEMIDNLDKTLTSRDKLEEEVKEKEILEQKLIEISRIDELTKIYNRRAFNDFYNSYYERAVRYKEDLGVIIFDIDDFKDINDKFGHLVGDSVLIKLSKEIKKLTRSSDIFARWGGEEFIILVPNSENSLVYELSERIRKSVENIDFGINTGITISLGIGMKKGNNTKDTILKKADDALYKAKSEGKNKSVVIN